MNEWLQILMMSLGGILFAAGGTHIPEVGGQKWLRRFVLPIALGGIAFWAGIEYWRCIGMAIGLCVGFHLPYGERTPYWSKALTACMFTAPTLFLGFSWFQIATPIAFLAMFYLSNTHYWGRLFAWKICEFLTGVYIAVTIVSLINQTFVS